MRQAIIAALTEASQVLEALKADASAQDAIARAGEMLVQTFRGGGRAFSCGNGGSMCDAMHFAEELTGRFREDRPAIAAVAISDPGYLTCVANDYGYDQVFARYVEAHGRKGDILLAISTSGESRNVVAAVDQARNRGVQSIGLVGKRGSSLGRAVDLEICTPGLGSYADRVQELHIKVIHILIELVEAGLFPRPCSTEP